MTQAGETGVAQDERWHLRKNGERFFVSGLLIAARDEAGRLTGFTKVARDQTDRKHAEEALIASEASCRQMAGELEIRVMERTRHLEQSVHAWESFCYSIAHDLRAPLRTISGFAEALLDDYTQALDQTAREYARRMAAAAHRLDEFIQDLLDFGRLAHVELPRKEVDLRTAIDQVLADLSSEIRLSNAEIQVLGEFPSVLANAAALKQVIANLMSNAIKFVAPGTAPRVEIYAQQAGEFRVQLWVRDHGIGIRPEHQERVFQLFERLHGQSEYPGTGAGLAIVRKAIERMGGQVCLRSAAGEGTSFWIELPLWKQDAATVEKSQLQPPGA
jgi:signal transduction histidine kinase